MLQSVSVRVSVTVSVRMRHYLPAAFREVRVDQLVGRGHLRR